MQIPLWQVDAFTARPFGGNPAAVCPLEEWLPDDVMQAIAAENNVSETAFFVRRPDGEFGLRWFTPRTEVDLCGHATLASAWVLTREIDPSRARVVFHTKSGPLTVTRAGDDLVMDLPARPPRHVGTPAALVQALGARPVSTLRARDLVAVFARAEELRALAPDMAAIEALDDLFAVTGSSHATLVPYWAERLGKKTLRARQVSARVGELGCALEGERVVLTGRAVVVVRGTMSI
jgi:PhzF family phenazine biosynthesis protein